MRGPKKGESDDHRLVSLIPRLIRRDGLRILGTFWADIGSQGNSRCWNSIAMVAEQRWSRQPSGASDSGVRTCGVRPQSLNLREAGLAPMVAQLGSGTRHGYDLRWDGLEDDDAIMAFFAAPCKLGNSQASAVAPEDIFSICLTALLNRSNEDSKTRGAG